MKVTRKMLLIFKKERRKKPSLINIHASYKPIKMHISFTHTHMQAFLRCYLCCRCQCEATYLDKMGTTNWQKKRVFFFKLVLFLFFTKEICGNKPQQPITHDGTWDVVACTLMLAKCSCIYQTPVQVWTVKADGSKHKKIQIQMDWSTVFGYSSNNGPEWNGWRR